MHTLKVTASIIILLSIIIISGLFSLKTLESSSKKIETRLLEVENCAEAGDWVEAKSSLTLVNKDWSKESKIWTALLDHIEIDNIDSSLIKVEKYIQSKDAPMALAEIAVLQQLIKHIPEKEAFNLKNIL